MNRVEISAMDQAEDLTPLVYGERSELTACTPAIVATAAFVAGTYVATYFRANAGFEAGLDEGNLVAPDADMNVGNLVQQRRQATSN